MDHVAFSLRRGWKPNKVYSFLLFIYDLSDRQRFGYGQTKQLSDLRCKVLCLVEADEGTSQNESPGWQQTAPQIH